MFETLFIFPLAFWVVVAILIGGGIWAIRHLRDGTGIPMLTLLGTVAVWYLGDALYNDYANNHVKLFDAATLANAWWQVAWFVAVFLWATPWLHGHLNARYLRRTSGVVQIFKHGVGQPVFQRQLTQLFLGCAWVWTVLAVIAIILLRERAVHFFFPFFGQKTSPWNHGQIGKGFDSLSIVAIYLHLLVAGVFGVVAALSTNRRTFALALFCCLTSWPYFILDRTRNIILAVVIPGVLSWIFLRLRGGMVKKLTVLGICFLLVNAWMGFVIANRDDKSIIGALKEKGFNLKENQSVHHLGLNMYEELCWINTFMQRGTYTCNWGYRYWTELVNPIPRILWPGKPYIGLDYAAARGAESADDEGGVGVSVTLSTGMIGGGVVNFGRLIGPAFAALLMSFWAAILARLDLQIHEFGRLPLYGLGLILTFNMGRDITLITLYPFVFGALLVWWRERSRRAGVHPTIRQSNQSKSRLQMLRRQRTLPHTAFGRRWKRGPDRSGHGSSHPIVASDAPGAKAPTSPLHPDAR